MVLPPRTSTPFPTRRSSDLLALQNGLAARVFANLDQVPYRLLQRRFVKKFVNDRNAHRENDPHDQDDDHDFDHGKSGETLDRKSTRLNSSHLGISYAVFCLK